ncbi:hypothetical protein B0H14DRAFT_3160250 [Mycena olivaceomarginata]|nr:hypothetical protein B0H14DRAFT_3160250 [Mycena olivaceomarginata]
MFPNHSRGQKSSPSPVTSTPPGHSRNRIACKNCRKRKLKCITTEKHPRLPCERCVKENATCEYAAVSNDEESSSRASPAPRWVEPLDPESYARSKGIFPAPQVPQMHNGYQHNAQTTNPSGSEPPPFPQSGGSYPGNLYRAFNSTGRSTPGNQSPPVGAPRYFPPSAPHIHYGPFPGPANTVYPWTQRRPE